MKITTFLKIIPKLRLWFPYTISFYNMDVKPLESLSPFCTGCTSDHACKQESIAAGCRKIPYKNHHYGVKQKILLWISFMLYHIMFTTKHHLVYILKHINLKFKLSFTQLFDYNFTGLDVWPLLLSQDSLWRKLKMWGTSK